MQRRDFLQRSTAIAWTMSWGNMRPPSNDDTVRLALIADLHQDLIPDGLERIESFSSAWSAIQPNSVIQLGDFAVPKPENRQLIERFHQLCRDPIHVLGNHDTDGGFRAEHCLEFLGMPARYYSREIHGIKFVVLDGNESGSPTHRGGYPSYVGPEQREWLDEQIRESTLPIVILSHQPLAGPHAVDNADEIRVLLERQSAKIWLVICGHTHIDYVTQIGTITFWHVNSASYFWVGDRYRHNSYPAETLARYPVLAQTCPYRDALFAMLEINLAERSIRISGQTTQWVGPSPKELKVELAEGLEHAEHVAPRISDREWKFSTHE